MKKKLASIIILVIIALGIVGVYFNMGLKLSKKDSYLSIGNKVSNIYIYNDDIIKVVDNIELNRIQNRTRNINIPISIYEENQENTSISNINVYFNGKKITKSFSIADWYAQSEKTLYSIYKENISIHNVPAGVHNVKIEYTYKCKDIIEQYNDITVFKLRDNTYYFSELEYNVSLPKSTNVFKINSKEIEVNKLNNNTYNLAVLGKTSGEYIEIKIEKGIINKGKIINKNLITHKFYQLFNADTAEDYRLLGILVAITIVLLIVVRLLTRNIKVEGYIRNPDELLDPIMAEAIIDRKIGAKELIMSCIVELIYRKKLRNIGNDAVEIVDLNQISEYERDVVDLIFGEKTRIEFEELKEIFIEKDKETAHFYQKFKRIKKKIEEKIYNYHIYSKVGEVILKTIRIVSFFILIALGGVLDKVLSIMGSNTFTIIMIIVCVIFNSKSFESKKVYDNLNKKSNGEGAKLFIYSIVLLCMVFVLIVFSFKYHKVMISGIFIVSIINIIIINRTKLHVFTQNGRIEYMKLAGLKNYIVDYSLMEQRDLDSVIIWDEYLAYSVAFGISNKVSKKFSENLMEANMIIQKIDRILRM